MLLPLILRKLSSARFRAREVLGQGVLPNAIILGGAKCGTTSLFEYLAQHPEVCVSRCKEVRFFDRQWEKGPRWYRANFSPSAGEHVVLEATPFYLVRPEVVERMRQTLEQPRFIVMLREPVARAYSHFNHFRLAGLETLCLEEALALEKDRHSRFGYRNASAYAPHVERWLAAFPRECFLFLKSEDMFAAPRSTFERVAAFLGIAPNAEIDFRARNQHWHEIPPNASPLLSDAFRESNARIEELVGISWS